MTQLAPKPKTRREILDGEIEWFQSLLDSLRDGEIESAIEVVEAAIEMLRRQREKL